MQIGPSRTAMARGVARSRSSTMFGNDSDAYARNPLSARLERSVTAINSAAVSARSSL